MGIAYNSVAYYGWSFYNEEDWKKLTNFLNPEKFPYGNNLWEKDEDGSDWEAKLNLAFETLFKHLNFEKIKNNLTFEVVGDFYDHNDWWNLSVLFGIKLTNLNYEQLGKIIKDNEEAFKRISGFLGTPSFQDGYLII